MTRSPMKLELKKNRLHKDIGKATEVKITKADIAKEKSKGGVSSSARSSPKTPRSGNTRERGTGSGTLDLLC